LKQKAIVVIILALAFLMSLTPWIHFTMLVTANPIPIPTPPIMSEEYINATISRTDGKLLARVNGTYPFEGGGSYYVTMYYPVPQDADKISVKMDETSLDWSYSDWTYPTVIGDWPMIYWETDPPYTFTIETYYEHFVPLNNGNYTFLYAMGTGKFLDYYTKETTAYVSVSISKDVAYSDSLINVYTITEDGVWKPANYNIAQQDETWVVTLTVVSPSWYPLTEDLLITIEGSKTWTVDDDGPADFHTIQEAVNAASLGDIIFVHSGTYYETVVVNKTVSLIGEDRNTTIIDGDLTKNVIEVTSDNVIISNFTMINSKGLGIYDSNGNTIKSNIIKGNQRGILLNQSSNNMIKNNIISGNWAAGVYLYHSNNNIIMNNNISNNGVIFMMLWYSLDGIDLYDSNNNTIFHNNLIGNTVSNRGTNSVNTWDNGYPSGGNYWGDVDYFGSDLYSGPYQNETGSDGIGDTPYIVDANNQDNYPFVNPWFLDKTPPVAEAGPNQTVYEDTPVTFDAGASSDNVGIVSYVWTFVDVTPQTLTGITPTYIFTSPGVYLVTLNVSDSAGNHATDKVTITVLSLPPEDLVQRLVETIDTWNLLRGTENRLTSKLEGALHLLEKGNENGAIHKLMGFMSQVEVLREKKLTSEQANYLIAEAQKIIDLING
jgi:parallel beta-helix repeat protein